MLCLKRKSFVIFLEKVVQEKECWKGILRKVSLKLVRFCSLIEDIPSLASCVKSLLFEYDKAVENFR